MIKRITCYDVEFALQHYQDFKDINDFARTAQNWRKFIVQQVNFRNRKNHLFEEFDLTKKIGKYLRKILGKDWKKLVFLPKVKTQLFESAEGVKKQEPILKPKKISIFEKLKYLLFWR